MQEECTFSHVLQDSNDDNNRRPANDNDNRSPASNYIGPSKSIGPPNIFS